MSVHTTGFSFRVKNHLTGGNGSHLPHFVYRRTDGSGHHLYGFSYDGTTNSSNDDLKYNGSAWVDADTSLSAFPFTISSSNGVYTLQQRNFHSPHEIYTRSTFGTNVVDRGVACPDPTISTGPNVTVTTNTNTAGRETLSADFTIISPVMVKTGAEIVRITYGDHYVIDPYIVRISYTDDTGANYVEHTNTTGSKNIQIDINFANVGIKSGSVYLSFNKTVRYNNVNYTAYNFVKTFTYYETGPYTASFSPNFGLPGQTITVSMIDTNPYPDNDTYWKYVSPNNYTPVEVLNSSSNYRFISSSFHEGNGVYTGDTEGSYYIYGPFSTEASVQADALHVLASATYNASYVAPTTTSNGGGKPDRYPLIMTNLFNRNRSIYSIGMTHKDTWDLFL